MAYGFRATYVVENYFKLPKCLRSEEGEEYENDLYDYLENHPLVEDCCFKWNELWIKYKDGKEEIISASKEAEIDYKRTDDIVVIDKDDFESQVGKEEEEGKSCCPYCNNIYSNKQINNGTVVPCNKCYKCFVGDCGITSCDCNIDKTSNKKTSNKKKKLLIVKKKSDK